MGLIAGTRVGPYEIVSPLGVGGMGEVYRARDTKLDRDVALKILPESFAADPDRLMRFTREAKTLASLNHPNIAAIYGIEESESRSPEVLESRGPGVQESGITRALVMELVEGEDLSERIARGPIPVGDALPIARQIVDALEAAHELGIVHRDLKPANIKVRPDGTVKVLDFGLAKALDPGTSDPSNHRTPEPAAATMTSPAITQMGVILGTAAYMSPEQAKGRAVDKRADIWAFGIVLYEMLTGRRPFSSSGEQAETLSETLAALLRDAPDWTALPSTAPANVRELLERCLEKDPRKRIRDIGDVRFELGRPPQPADTTGTTVAGQTHRERWLWLGGTLVLAAGLAVSLVTRGAPAATSSVLRADLSFGGITSEYGSRQPQFAITKDGRSIAFAGRDETGSRLYLRSLDRESPVALRGTENGAWPFFSSDGQWLGFFEGGHIKKVALSGGTPVDVAPAADPRGLTWGDDGTIVFSPSVAEALWKVPAEGGLPEQLTTLDPAAHERTHRFPDALPGGRGVLFTIGSSDMTSWDEAKIAVLAPGETTPKILIEGGTMGRYASSGHIVYNNRGELLAVPFDLGRLEVTGTPVSILSDVGFKDVYGVADFAMADDALVYLPGGETQAPNRLVEATRDGRLRALSQVAANYNQGRLSKDGQRLLIVIEAANDTLWMVDLRRDTRTRLTFRGNINGFAWSEDETKAVYTVGKEVRSVSTDGNSTDTLLYSAEWPVGGIDVQGDETGVIFDMRTVSSYDLWRWSATSGTASGWLETQYNEGAPRLSPDGHVVAYIGDEAGPAGVFLRRASGGSEKVAVSASVNIDSGPIWSRQGRELLYIDDGQVMAVDVRTDPRLDAGVPQTLFQLPERAILVDASSDGQRLILVQGDLPPEPKRIALIAGWNAFVRGLEEGRR